VSSGSATVGVETGIDPSALVHLGIWRDEHDDLTRRFFRWDVPDLPPEVRVAASAGVRTDVVGPNLSTMSDLLQPGYLPFETGVAHGPQSELCVAVLTDWPGTTPAMVDWWFGWHITASERYKLWHPQAHLFSQARFDRSSIEGLTDRQRYLGNTSWVDEYIGPFATQLAISFRDPAEIGFTSEAMDAAGIGTVVVAETTDRTYGHHLSHLVHVVRHTATGSEMRSRFVLPAGTPEFVGGALLDHCWTEMSHLATFLPDLHRAVTLGGPDDPLHT
jgi:hypothetical protein